MEDKTIYYEGVYSTQERIISLILFLAVSYACVILALRLQDYLSLLYLIIFWSVFTGWLISLNRLYRKVVLTLFPDGRVHIGPKDFLPDKQPLNTYAFLAGKSQSSSNFLFTLANIAKVYQTPQITPGQKINANLFYSPDPSTRYATKKDKTVCFELKTPLMSYSALWKKIGDRDFWGKKYPPIQKIFISVTDPEKLVREIRLRAGLKAR